MIVTGGAGFIGSHLADELVKDSNVTVIDNLSSGSRKNLNRKASFVKRDLCLKIEDVFSGEDSVFHVAAHPRVDEEPVKYLKDIEMAINVLEACRRKDVEKIIFTSSSLVYGKVRMPADESEPLSPVSVYAASKAACEALIVSYSYSYGMRSWIYRLANVVGPRLNHGIVFDFVGKLKKNPGRLEILGDGKQERSYVHVSDCVSGILRGLGSEEKVNVFNLGSCDTLTASEIANLTSFHMNLSPKFSFSGGKMGWRGDVSRMLLSSKRLERMGWKPRFNSKEAVSEAILSLL